MEVHELLTKALEYLEEVGWTPGAGDYDGRYAGRTCMMGGVYAATGGVYFQMHPALTALQNACGDQSLIRFNDSQTSFAPIKAAFCRAIEATTPREDRHERLQAEAPRTRDTVGAGAPG